MTANQVANHRVSPQLTIDHRVGASFGSTPLVLDLLPAAKKGTLSSSSGFCFL